MTSTIPNHAHCRTCGRAVQFGEETCSKACRAKIDELQKKKRNIMLFIYAMIGLSVVLLLMQLSGAGA